MSIILSLIPGQDALGRALEAEGFVVVRDANVLTDGVIGCEGCGNDPLIAFRLAMQHANWWLLETNRCRAPYGIDGHLFSLNPHHFGGAENRLRCFVTNLDLRDGLNRVVLPPQRRIRPYRRTRINGLPQPMCSALAQAISVALTPTVLRRPVLVDTWDYEPELDS